MRIHSYDDLKRVMYLSIFTFSILGLATNLAMNYYSNYVDNFIVLQWVFLIWDLTGWILVYKRLYFKLVEVITLVLITCSHLAIVYDGTFHLLANGKDGVFGISLIWVPVVIVSFFLILRAKWGLIYSLCIFAINLLFGLMNFHRMSINDILAMTQFYVAYLVYILIFYYSLYFIKIFAEMETLRKSAYSDSLTGIGNRHQINMWLEDHLQMTEPLSLIFFDIDHFKKVNDTYGHKVGDLVLKEMTKVINGSLVAEERFGRWGGEEFVIMVSGTSVEATKLAERLRDLVHQHTFEVAGKQTISIGVTEYIRGESVDALLSRVDTALYQSKQKGRDRVTAI